MRQVDILVENYKGKTLEIKKNNEKMKYVLEYAIPIEIKNI